MLLAGPRARQPTGRVVDYSFRGQACVALTCGQTGRWDRCWLPPPSSSAHLIKIRNPSFLLGLAGSVLPCRLGPSALLGRHPVLLLPLPPLSCRLAGPR